MFRERLSALFPLSEEQLSRLEAHYRLLVKWNRVINLTRVEDEDEAAVRHFGEAIFLASCLPAGSAKVADVGSGGGFPGVPIAIVRPELSVTLVESDRRKASFLKEAVRGWSNARVLACRAEDISERFDWVVSRAVSWDDIQRFARPMAPRFALLSSKRMLPQHDWQAIPLPWDADRLVLCST